MRALAVAALLLITVGAHAVPMTVGDIARVDFESSDWLFGTADPNLSMIGPRIGFCGHDALSASTVVSGDPDCDLTGDDIFQISIYSAADELLFASSLPVGNSSFTPNTWSGNLFPRAGEFFPRTGYLTFELFGGSLDFHEIFLIGFEATPPSFIVNTPRLDFVVSPDAGGTVSVPEPTTLSLLSLGLLGLGAVRRVRTRPR